MIRRPNSILLAMLALTLLAAPLVAQTTQYISVSDSSFEWTGKEDRTAKFSWATTVTNPTKRPDLDLLVTLTLVDDTGNVVATDSTTVTVDQEGEAQVMHTGSLPYDDAATVAQYRVSVESADK